MATKKKADSTIVAEPWFDVTMPADPPDLNAAAPVPIDPVQLSDGQAAETLDIPAPADPAVFRGERYLLYPHPEASAGTSN